MPSPNDSSGFLSNRYVRVLSAVLILQAGLFYTVSRGESVPSMRPLQEFPAAFKDWKLLQEGHVDEETQAVLKADDTLTRFYGNQKLGAGANLFIAFFKTQRAGQVPHSPKNCMPGSGWEPSVEGYLNVNIDGLPKPIKVNHYVIAKGDQKSSVLYWYQSKNRAVASEYESKFWTVADAIRYNRTDLSIVRVLVPFSGNDGTAATNAAVNFIQAFYADLRRYLPT